MGNYRIVVNIASPVVGYVAPSYFQDEEVGGAVPCTALQGR